MFLSFVIPIYNAEKYIDEMMNSLLNQDISKNDYEIICINDGSTDNSLTKLQKYANDYENIKLINKQNAGVSAARNDGIKKARGDYVWSIDADDFILENICGELKKIAENSNADGIDIQGYMFYKELNNFESESYKRHTTQSNIYMYNINAVVCILKRSFLTENNLFFNEELDHGEDGLFMFEYSLCSPKRTSLNKAVYYYRRNAESATMFNTLEALRKKESSLRKVSTIYYEYYSKKIGDLSRTADLLMSNLWMELRVLAMMPFSERNRHLNELKRYGLFPMRKPKECTLKKSYMTTRSDFVGKLFEWIYMHMNRRFGFFLMCVWCQLEKIKSLRS